MSILRMLEEAGRVSLLDVHFAGLMMRLSEGAATPGLELAAALVSAGCREGHTCLPLDRLAGGKLLDDGDGVDADLIRAPGLDEWRACLRRAPVVGDPHEDSPRPLVLDGRDRLYLRRYWDYEERLAASLRIRAGGDVPLPAPGKLEESLDRYFPMLEGRENLQRQAAVVACMKRLCVISGGPGTGKTWTIARILAVILEQFGEDRQEDAPVIALAAPTGKAAARLQESIAAAKTDPAFPEPVRTLIPDTASTLHRLLGARRGSPFFRHDENNPLPHDVIVVDEVSMVDLALMAKLVRAVKPGARLILLGDKDQLASVEAGAVLADVCSGAASREPGAGPTPGGALGDAIVLLTENRRMKGAGNVALLSAAVNRGEEAETLEILRPAREGKAGDLLWEERRDGHEFVREVGRLARDWYGGLREEGSAKAALDAFQQFRILCALREGPQGVNRVNEEVERALGVGVPGLRREVGAWYHGRPVMVTRNDYSLGLFNGDVGIAWSEARTGDLRVYFPMPDGSMRGLPPSRIPEHETAYALTVHKSQGSEFSAVLLVLPGEDTPLLTRELLYTALTRARDRVELWGSEELVRRAVSRRVTRVSGLGEKLRNG